MMPNAGEIWVHANKQYLIKKLSPNGLTCVVATTDGRVVNRLYPTKYFKNTKIWKPLAMENV